MRGAEEPDAAAGARELDAAAAATGRSSRKFEADSAHDPQQVQRADRSRICQQADFLFRRKG